MPSGICVDEEWWNPKKNLSRCPVTGPRFEPCHSNLRRKNHVWWVHSKTQGTFPLCPYSYFGAYASHISHLRTTLCSTFSSQYFTRWCVHFKRAFATLLQSAQAHRLFHDIRHITKERSFSERLADSKRATWTHSPENWNPH
jgi:hypothetical protein